MKIFNYSQIKPRVKIAAFFISISYTFKLLANNGIKSCHLFYGNSLVHIYAIAMAADFYAALSLLIKVYNNSSFTKSYVYWGIIDHELIF